MATEEQLNVRCTQYYLVSNQVSNGISITNKLGKPEQVMLQKLKVIFQWSERLCNFPIPYHQRDWIFMFSVQKLKQELSLNHLLIHAVMGVWVKIIGYLQWDIHQDDVDDKKK